MSPHAEPARNKGIGVGVEASVGLDELCEFGGEFSEALADQYDNIKDAGNLTSVGGNWPRRCLPRSPPRKRVPIRFDFISDR